MSSNVIKLVGVDPGFGHFGVSAAVIGAEGLRYTRVEVWETTPDDAMKRKADDSSQRVRWLTQKFMAFVAEESPIAICTEIQAMGGNTCRRCNPKAKFTVQTQVLVNIGRVRGMIDAVSELHSIPVFEETAVKMKVASAGAGNASKLEVSEGIERLYPGTMRLFPHYRGKIKKGDVEHAADACAAIHVSKDQFFIVQALRDRGIVEANDPRLELPY